MKLNIPAETLLGCLGQAQVDNLLQLALDLAQYQVVISISLALQVQARYRLHIGTSLAHSLLHVLPVHEALLSVHVILWSSNSSPISKFGQILLLLAVNRVDAFYDWTLAPRLSWYLRFY